MLVPRIVRSSHICELVRVFVPLVVVRYRPFIFPSRTQRRGEPRTPDARAGQGCGVAHDTDDFWVRLIPAGRLAWVISGDNR